MRNANARLLQSVHKGTEEKEDERAKRDECAAAALAPPR
jgi:hypothetical protein